MILRKPYAFFIKYFRLINGIIAGLMLITIFSTNKILRFFLDYISDYKVATNNFILGSYFNFFTYFIPILVIIGSIIVLSVLIVKDKPKRLYIINIITYVILLIVLAFNQGSLNSIKDLALDIRVSKAFRDIDMLLLIIEIVNFILMLIRAIGFDIKNFDFKRDLEDMDISTKDSEEFEVSIDIDQNKIKRNIIRTLRNLKYFYYEHKLFSNILIIFLILLIPGWILIKNNILTENYKEGITFNLDNMAINIRKTYILNTDADNNKLTDNKHDLVAVKFDIKKYGDQDTTLNTGLVSLIIGKKYYSIDTTYYPDLSDVGTGYVNQNIDNDFTNYIFIFEVPKNQINKTMKLKINDDLSYALGQTGIKNKYIKLEPVNLLSKQKIKEYKVGDTINFDGSIIGNSSFTIKEYKIANKFKADYRFCAKKDNCYDSYEYITPTATDNYFKTLLKLNATYQADSILNLGVNDVYSFLNNYGTIYYKIGDNWYNRKINSKLIKPKIASDSNYYIEIDKNTEQASNIYILFKIRNYTYKYILK